MLQSAENELVTCGPVRAGDKPFGFVRDQRPAYTILGKLSTCPGPAHRTIQLRDVGVSSRQSHLWYRPGIVVLGSMHTESGDSDWD